MGMRLRSHTVHNNNDSTSNFHKAAVTKEVNKNTHDEHFGTANFKKNGVIYVPPTANISNEHCRNVDNNTVDNGGLKNSVISVSPNLRKVKYSLPKYEELRRNCDCCVRKKVKCTGGNPCQGCRRKYITCTYSVKRRPGPKVQSGVRKAVKKRNKIINRSNSISSFTEMSSGGEGNSHSDTGRYIGDKCDCLPVRQEGDVRQYCNESKTTGKKLAYHRKKAAPFDVTDALLSLKHACVLKLES